MKMKHEAELDRNEMSMFRWTGGFNLKERKKFTELVGPEPDRLSKTRGRLGWFGYVK